MWNSSYWGWGSKASTWWPGLDQNGSVGPAFSSLTTSRKLRKLQSGLGGIRDRGLLVPHAIGTWHATSLGEGITSERGWTRHYSGVAQWEQ